MAGPGPRRVARCARTPHRTRISYVTEITDRLRQAHPPSSNHPDHHRPLVRRPRRRRPLLDVAGSARRPSDPPRRRRGAASLLPPSSVRVASLGTAQETREPPPRADARAQQFSYTFGDAVSPGRVPGRRPELCRPGAGAAAVQGRHRQLQPETPRRRSTSPRTTPAPLLILGDGKDHAVAAAGAALELQAAEQVQGRDRVPGVRPSTHTTRVDEAPGVAKAIADHALAWADAAQAARRPSRT